MIGVSQIFEIDAWDGAALQTLRYSERGRVPQAGDVPQMAEGSINLLKYSGQLDNSVWVKYGASAVTSDTTLSPDSTMTADTLYRTATAASYLQQSATKSAASSVYTFSIFAKKISSNNVALRIQGQYPARADVRFNLATGQISTAAVATGGFTSVSASIVASTDGWYRLSLTATSDNHTTISALISPNSNNADLAGVDSSAASSCYTWGGQLEGKPYATPYIPTTTAAATRPPFIPVGIIDPGLLKYAMFSGGKTSGASTYSFGEAVFNNADKSLDNWRNYSFDGFGLRMFEGPVGAAFPAGYMQVYTATISAPPVFSWDTVSFPLKGKQIDLNAPVPSGTFQGNNVGAAGVEGGADLKGKTKPMVLGRAPNFTVYPCNASKLIYAVSPANGVAVTYMGSMFAVYDTGAELIYEGTYSSQSDMEANVPNPGKYRVWEQGGYFRLGSPAAGVVTCDAVSYGRSVTAKVGNLISDLLTLAGVSFDAPSITALNSAFLPEVGVYLNGETIATALDQLCASCGAYWYFTPLGVLKVGQLVDPATLTADYSLSTVGTAIHKAEIQKTQDTPGGIPAHIVTLLRSRNYTVQPEAFGVVPEARKVWLKEQFRKTQIINTAVKTAHPLSEEMQIETSLTQDNVAEATRRAGLYSVPRDIVVLELSLDAFGSTANIRPGLCVELSLSDALTVTGNRFGYINKKMILVGFTINRVTERISATFWG